MLAQTVMLQGTASHVGKSVLTAALCRALARRGYRVAPFKAQNMSLNSAVAADGGEIGRSQAFQAAACGVEPETAMNPVLLKPLGGHRCQVVVRGRPLYVAEGYGRPEHTAEAIRIAGEALEDLRRRFEVVVLEGMGSPAEINLRDRDGANMPIAALAEAPVLLVGDIERGGVFASLAGTLELLSPDDRDRVKGFLINKFHGDPTVLQPGLDYLSHRYGVPTLGVLPWLADLRVEEEDAVALSARNTKLHSGDALEVVVLRLPAVSNFTDFAPLEAEPGVCVRYVTRVEEWGNPALVILPGSRSVAADLYWLRERGLASRLTDHARAGGRIIGLCGGYQMLGRRLLDPEGIESAYPEMDGLGLLDAETTLAAEKTLDRVEGRCLLPGLEGLPVRGYEIHHGTTRRGRQTMPALTVTRSQKEGKISRPEGGVDPSGKVFGTYLHGFFDAPELRNTLLQHLGAGVSQEEAVQPVFDRLADWFEANTDFEAILRMATTG